MVNCSIFNGFTVPLKKQHIKYLMEVILPLHKPRLYLLYGSELSYCVSIFLEKSPNLAETVFVLLDLIVRLFHI